MEVGARMMAERPFRSGFEIPCAVNYQMADGVASFAGFARSRALAAQESFHA